MVSRPGPIATGWVSRDRLREVHEAEAVYSLKARRSFGPPGFPADELAADGGDPERENDIEPEDLLPRHSRRDPAPGVGALCALFDLGPRILPPDRPLPPGGRRVLALWGQPGR